MTSSEDKAESLDVVQSTERWSEYRLADGSVIKAKVTIVSAKRLDGKFDVTGKPIYNLDAAVTLAIEEIPPELMKPL